MENIKFWEKYSLIMLAICLFNIMIGNDFSIYRLFTALFLALVLTLVLTLLTNK